MLKEWAGDAELKCWKIGISASKLPISFVYERMADRGEPARAGMRLIVINGASMRVDYLLFSRTSGAEIAGI
ncbi:MULTISPECIES: hypothetical protein [unclassified Bradyrhizobium]|uniref:hypothetical protein n=1 Tax=unclassified Bradyrhizobium TaxID=2631580 RepID=UPI0024E1173B|nr:MULTISPECIES: hypothetical protein [unclassified Bradyrhizobium]